MKILLAALAVTALAGCRIDPVVLADANQRTGYQVKGQTCYVETGNQSHRQAHCREDGTIIQHSLNNRSTQARLLWQGGE